MNDPGRASLVLVSGLSGSGKSVALAALEDRGFYCVDNLPAGMLPALAEHVGTEPDRYRRVAVGVDARAGPAEVVRLPELIRRLAMPTTLVFLEADSDVLIRRFSETRRRHPLAAERTLAQAIEEEQRMLRPLSEQADHVVDTTDTNIHELRRRIWRLVGPSKAPEISNLALESFAFKRGVPDDVDLVFDARCLPNPHWVPELRAATGLERAVREYLGAEPLVAEFRDDVDRFVRRWLPVWAEEGRSHLTVAIGCTGGKHRSVYLVDELAATVRATGQRVEVARFTAKDGGDGTLDITGGLDLPRPLVAVSVGSGEPLPPGATIPTEESAGLGDYMQSAGRILGDFEATVQNIRSASEPLGEPQFAEALRNTSQNMERVTQLAAEGNGTVQARAELGPDALDEGAHSRPPPPRDQP